MLPKIELPIYEINLPSTGKKIKIRPFVVKEEKLLLMSLESNDDDYIIETTKQIINNCVIDKIDIEELPFFDIDYIFISLRAKSVGESIAVKFTCNSPSNTGICGHEFTANIDISNSKIIKNEDIKPEVKVYNVTIKLKYPSYDTIKKLNNNEEISIFDNRIKLISECIDMVVDGDSVQTRKDFTPEELVEFVENLPQEHFKKLERFVDNFPSFVVTAKAKCPTCKTTHNIEYSEFESFFV